MIAQLLLTDIKYIGNLEGCERIFKAEKGDMRVYTNFICTFKIIYQNILI